MSRNDVPFVQDKSIFGAQGMLELGMELERLFGKETTKAVTQASFMSRLWEKLPRCNHIYCSRIATRASVASGYRCDTHSAGAEELPYAAEVREFEQSIEIMFDT